MTEEAWRFYDGLQLVDDAGIEVARDTTIKQIIDHLTVKMDSDARAVLYFQLSREDVKRSLLSSGLNKATGLDRLLYKLWRGINEKYKKEKNLDDDGP